MLRPVDVRIRSLAIISPDVASVRKDIQDTHAPSFVLQELLEKVVMNLALVDLTRSVIQLLANVSVSQDILDPTVVKAACKAVLALTVKKLASAKTAESVTRLMARVVALQAISVQNVKSRVRIIDMEKNVKGFANARMAVPAIV